MCPVCGFVLTEDTDRSCPGAGTAGEPRSPPLLVAVAAGRGLDGYRWPDGATSRENDDLNRAVRHAAYLRRGFYVVVLFVALAGQVSGATSPSTYPPCRRSPPCAPLVLGGMVVLTNADLRRRLGERAIGSRILSAAIAAAATAWAAHHNHLTGGFFAGTSALGYLVWLTHSENVRRDRLRARGGLPPTTPAYELLSHWGRHPILTHHARTLAKADPGLGLYGSIAAAAHQHQQHRRRRAIATVLHGKIRAAVDTDTAAVAVAVYDLEQIAHQLADGADYQTLTDPPKDPRHPHRGSDTRIEPASAARR